MNDTPQIHYWEGRPITDLSREELIGVIEYMARWVDMLQAQAEAELGALIGKRPANTSHSG